MDVFDELLRNVRGNGSVFGQPQVAPMGSLRLGESAYLTLCAPMRGSGVLDAGAGQPRRIVAGQTAIVCGPEPFTFTDAPEPGADSSEPTVLMVGSYDIRAEVPHRLLRVLPRVAVVTDAEDCGPLRDYLQAQLSLSGPGRQIVLDRLLDWLLVCTLRDWFDRPEAEPPSWYRALGDAVVGPALAAMHADPARAWSTAELAATAGVARTTFTSRFTAAVGQSPAAYLTEWRLTLAADLLAHTELTVAAIARRVGYADAFGFSSAFKRVRGMSPSAYRRSTSGASDIPVAPGDYPRQASASAAANAAKVRGSRPSARRTPSATTASELVRIELNAPDQSSISAAETPCPANSRSKSATSTGR
ncbi:AraC family transcriptional regulator [Nocardia cyriacigeorgica]|uniref:AraC family transcriptional regulator n=1 Tax=Nocardia cyriacigeorgica TaxID=135487 RepID=UPI0018937FB9|nr:AraC family transcriptional regulator [Nocardia cyriacigeorgica]MBF6439231.1 AraC family transcriptional regulator [Nocardia cyriacigeorgica]